MALQDFAEVGLLLDGNPLELISECRLNTESGNQTIDVIKQGLAGFSSGPGRCTITLSYPIPIGGTEYPYQKKCANKEYVTAQFFRADGDYIGTGKLQNCDEGQSTGSPTDGKVEWVGELKPYK